jgi:methionyl-tRNA synthetase
MQQKFLVTPALPYANGPIHLGHLLEHIQVNIFIRALRMAGEDVLYICGADSHGTPIEMNAQKAGVLPEQFASSWQKKQEISFKAFGIEFDGGYGSTHTKENEHHAQKIFASLKEQGLIEQREIEQLYDPELKRFLPDRMVRGICPRCHAKDQYGDSCEVCGRTYHPTELIEPKSALSGAHPVMKKSSHYFVSLKHFEAKLKEWLNEAGTLHEDSRAFLDHWFNEGLKDWDISRDGPYFGFLIPGEGDKYFYVWLDAPIGYISISEKAAAALGRSFADYWQNKDTTIIHFIGKDIVYFHTLFWPAMLMSAQYTLPKKVVVHGMVTIDGEKMSKSRGTFILADTFQKHINTEALRYYFACKLSKRSEDIDLNFGDFIQRVNTDLVNKIVNLISRSLPLLHRYFAGQAGMLDDQAKELVAKAQKTVQIVKELYLDNEPARALNEIVRLAEDANKYLQEEAPWKVVEQDKKRAHNILTTGLYVGKICFGLLKPVLPSATRVMERILQGGKELSFANIAEPFPEGFTFQPYEHLFTRILEESIKNMIDESKIDQGTPAPAEEKISFIDINDFMKIDLRAAKVISAKPVEGSDKLIACELDLGPLGKRQVFSGVRPHITPEEMVGKMVVLVMNLAPRKMRFGISEGMILAAGDDKPSLILCNDAKPGERVR